MATSDPPPPPRSSPSGDRIDSLPLAEASPSASASDWLTASSGSAEERLRRSLILQRIAGRVARIGGWSVDLEANVNHWSEEMFEILEWPGDTPPPLDEALRLYPPEWRETVQRVLHLCATEGTPFEVEVEIYSARGRRLWVRAAGEAQHGSRGVRTVVGAFQDITARKEAELSIRASEERFRLLSTTTSDALWEWNFSTNALTWNDGLQAMFGFDPHDIDQTIGFWTTHIHPDDAGRVTASLARALDDGRDVWSEEYRFRKADGRYAYVLDRGRVVRDTSGTGVAMVGGVTDLTVRRLAEDRIAEQAAVLDQANDAIVIRDLDHRVTFWNRGAERLYGWASDEAIGRPLSELLSDDPAPFVAASGVVMGEGEWAGELQHFTRDGRHVAVLCRWTVMRDRAGEPRAILAIHTDVTDRRRLEQQFLRAQRMESIGTLAGGIAHDLNNVLAPILLSLDLLGDSISDEDGRQLLSTIRSSAERGATLVQQVLSFARGVDAVHQGVNVAQLASDVRLFVAETFPRTIRCQLDVQPDLWKTRGDQTQIHQVLMNLCVNARDAMPSGGTLNIAVDNVEVDALFANLAPESRPGRYVRMRVADTGSGIAPAVLEKIFEPFFSTKETGKGTGLGLSTSLAIIRSHGGFITVDSRLEAGTTFTVYLPADTDEGEDDTRTTEPPGAMEGKGELVLLVDDEENVREVARQSLERHGYRVLTASHGAEAVALYAERRDESPIVVTDMTMPVMDGPSTVIALRSLDPRVRIVGMSGLGPDGQVHGSTTPGLARFMAKPYTTQTLLRVLREVIEST